MRGFIDFTQDDNFREMEKLPKQRQKQMRGSFASLRMTMLGIGGTCRTQPQVPSTSLGQVLRLRAARFAQNDNVGEMEKLPKQRQKQMRGSFASLRMTMLRIGGDLPNTMLGIGGTCRTQPQVPSTSSGQALRLRAARSAQNGLR
jgi:hypothetical protein